MQCERLRLFFALDCPSGLASAISHWRDGLHLPGRPVATDNLHLTLAFLGSQPLTRLAELRQVAASLHLPGFVLHLDRLQQRRNGLLYLAPSQPPEALLTLADSLQQALRELGIALDERAFHAHLTLMRRCPRRPAAAAPSFTWTVDHFCLFASQQASQGINYHRLQQWPLLPQAHAAESDAS
ncbi:RNA 2',3'-cyclic phosphodiesterase [Pseudomonas zhanjiangensis]|uniref:RNA 2',3'-cyclic phosphodiesterase n=1 Tax=Pseudomonas zhanjiangensis TaxID=3239015 RepID=A0ABV3YW94_9PSED